MSLAIEARGVEKHFGEVKALAGVDLDVERGSVVGLLGPNGAGKTTMVKVLSTLLMPTAGTAKVGGFDVVTQADEVRHTIGLTGQYAAVDEYLTGRENLHLFGALYHLPPAKVRERAEELLEQFTLTDAADRMLKTYSGGMRRRLDLAASLIAAPSILFLDEPTTGLDPRSRLGMWEVITSLVNQGTTVLLTTQYLEEADQLADRIVVIDKGLVIANGTSDELKSQVGGDRLEIVISDAARLADARAALAHIASGEIIATDVSRTLLAPISGGSSVLPEAIRTLDAAAVRFDDIALRRPTLDDVFLALTGHVAEEEAEQAPKRRGRKKRAA
ncbi:MAG: ATP-binding cassette domain-containing protein [Actinomycetales bacterium]|nr:ATP-binding cassette domain-containing protein [Actinomycetales bacterium]